MSVNNSQNVTAPQADIQPNSENGLEDTLNPIFKAIADLQEAVKTLATAVSSGAEAQEGLQETMATKSDIESFKKEIAEEIKKFSVGFREAAAVNKPLDRFGAIGTPAKSESAKDTVTAEGNAVREAGFENLQKGQREIKKGIESLDTPRPQIEVGTRLQDASTQSEDLIKGVLEGNIKPYQAGKKAYNLQYGGNY